MHLIDGDIKISVFKGNWKTTTFLKRKDMFFKDNWKTSTFLKRKDMFLICGLFSAISFLCTQTLLSNN